MNTKKGKKIREVKKRTNTLKSKQIEARKLGDLTATDAERPCGPKSKYVRQEERIARNAVNLITTAIGVPQHEKRTI